MGLLNDHLPLMDDLLADARVAADLGARDFLLAKQEIMGLDFGQVWEARHAGGVFRVMCALEGGSRRELAHLFSGQGKIDALITSLPEPDADKPVNLAALGQYVAARAKRRAVFYVMDVYRNILETFEDFHYAEAWKMVQLLIWTMQRGTKGESSLEHQPVLYGAIHGDGKVPTVPEKIWRTDIAPPRFFGEQVPSFGLVKLAIRTSVKESGVVFDPFSHVGTALLATAELGGERSCLALFHHLPNMALALQRAEDQGLAFYMVRNGEELYG